MTDREAFCMVLSHGPLLPGDALIVPAGDGMVRVDVAEEILRQRAAEVVVVTGGLKNAAPYALHADELARALIGRGLDPNRITKDAESMHTKDQADFVAGQAIKHKWDRILIAVSPYHAPRLFLTFLRAFLDAGIDDKVQMLTVPASGSWFRNPDGSDETRYKLMAGEFDKIQQYGEMGHVATYAEGLAYLKLWEGVE